MHFPLLDKLKSQVFIIAEIGNNHNGSVETAKRLIDIAAEAKVDAVKFQTFNGIDVVSPLVKANEYKGWNPEGFEFWVDFVDSIALPLKEHKGVFEYALRKGLIPFSTPTSPRIVDFLESIDNPIYKIASMDVTNIPLLKSVAATGKPVIMSTGMASEDEVEIAIRIFKDNELAVLHCISDYPTKPEHVNLLSVPYLAERYQVVTGFSDHSLTNEFAIASVALGGRIIEKHITYSRKAPEKAEHHFALEPQEFADMVTAIRKIELGMGTKKLVRSTSELENKVKYRRGLHLNKDKRSGEMIEAADIAVVRPAIGADVSSFEFFVGKVLSKNVKAWTGLKHEDIAS